MSAIVRHSDIDKWEALALYVFELAAAAPRTLHKLRDLRDAANTAVVLGPDGAENPCRRLLEVVNRKCDPTVPDDLSPALVDASRPVIRRVQAERTLRRAGRSA